MSVGTSIDDRIDSRSLLSLGKRVRMDRIMDRKTGRTVIIPMDHAASGFLEGLENMTEAVDKVARGGANAIVQNPGIIKYSYRGSKGSGRDIGLIMHLTIGNDKGPYKNFKVPVATVEDALKVSADGVSVHVNVGSESQEKQLEHFGNVVSKCEEWEMPLLAMMYYRGPEIKKEESIKKENVKYIARLGAETGADLIKVSYTGDKKSFEEVVKACPVPIVMAGGPKRDKEKNFFQDVYDSLQAGGKGVATGRNVFLHQDPTYMTRVLCGIVHENMEVKEAIEYASNIENFKN
jgi:predicted phospho-2-dehydro-3-deoxyheptonate aldolase